LNEWADRKIIDLHVLCQFASPSLHLTVWKM